MGGYGLQFALVFAGGLATGASIAWLLRSSRAARELETAEGNWQRKIDQAITRARILGNESTSLRVNLEATQEIALRSKHEAISSSTELESLRDELEALRRDLATARANRDDLAAQLGRHRQRLQAAQNRARELGAEFGKSREFYKSELATAVERRRSLERELEDADRRIVALEADNAELRHRPEAADRPADSGEATAEAEDTTMRAIGIRPPDDGEGDDLTQIVGIGKVFEAMLHDLGIYYFRQIATFGPAELERVNAELREFRGRIEHDDWIGQARELHYRKYGESADVADAG